MTAILALVAAAAAVHAGSEFLPDPSSSPSQVDGVIAGTPEEFHLLREALGDSLSRQGLALALTSASRIAANEVTRSTRQTESVVARFRLDLTSLPVAKLYLTDGDRRRVYVRWLSLTRGLDPVAIELVRFVIDSSIEAIRAGREIGVSREEYDSSLGIPAGKPSAAPPAPLAPSPSEGAGVQLVVEAAYEGTQFGGGEYQQGPAISFSVRMPRLWIGAYLLSRLPITIGDNTVGARLFVGGLRMTAAVPVVTSQEVTVAFGAGAGIDASQIRPGANRSDLAAAPPFWATTPVLRVFGAVERIFGRFSVAAIVGIDLDLLGERYVVAEAASDRDAFVPWRFRPMAALLLGVRR